MYLRDMVERYITKRILKSSNVLLLKVPRFKTKTSGTRTLAYAATSHCNSLPMEIRAVDNIDSFKSSLKTHFFKLAHNILQQV